MSKWAEVLRGWKGRKGRDLIKCYGRRHSKVGAKPQLLRHPRFVAGNLLVNFGGTALQFFQETQAKFGKPYPAKIGTLLESAIEEELALVHGVVTCCRCGRQSGDGEKLLPWLCVPKDGRWACPDCVKEHAPDN